MMIKVLALEAGHIELRCSECPTWRAVWMGGVSMVVNVSEMITAAMGHAEEHGVDEIRGELDAVFSRPGGGQDTRCPVLSLPPGPIKNNSAGPVTVRDDHSGCRPDRPCRAVDCDDPAHWRGL